MEGIKMVTKETIARGFGLPIEEVKCLYCDNYNSEQHYCYLWETNKEEDFLCSMLYPRKKKK